jgi:hypothetical protein
MPLPSGSTGRMQLLRNQVLRDTGKFDKRTPVRDLDLAFEITYVYDYIKKLYRKQAEVIQMYM